MKLKNWLTITLMSIILVCSNAIASENSGVTIETKMIQVESGATVINLEVPVDYPELQNDPNYTTLVSPYPAYHNFKAYLAFRSSRNDNYCCDAWGFVIGVITGADGGIPLYGLRVGGKDGVGKAEYEWLYDQKTGKISKMFVAHEEVIDVLNTWGDFPKTPVNEMGE